jgi:hypothetical protein
MEMPPSQIPAEPLVHALGCTGFGCLFYRDIDGCFPGSSLLTSQDVLKGDSVGLDDDELMLYLLGHGIPHDTGITNNHGIPYPAQLLGTFPSGWDLPSN